VLDRNRNFASEIYGTKLAEGQFDRKDIQDALELAVNMHIANTLDMEGKDWREPMAKIDELLSRLPTQRVRSEEQVSFQQFSTPPNYAAAAVYVANLRQGDVMLEPSAGTGSLVAPAMQRGGVKIVANELSERRAALLRALVGPYNKVFHENAEQLNNVLPDDIKPTVVVMNPPFSQTAGRMGDRKVPITAAIHIEQALKKLEPGGRLVAIVVKGMTMGAPAFRAWWGKITKDYNVRANIGVEGKVYEKYGTTFGTRLLVIDKVKPAAGDKPVLAEVASVDDLMRTLEPIRDARPTAEQHGAEQGGTSLAEGSQGGRAGVLSASSKPGEVGTGAGSDVGVGKPGGGGATSGRPVRVEGGKRPALDSDKPERPIEAGTVGAPAQSPEYGGRPAAGGASRPGNDLRAPGGGKPGPVGKTEQIELAHADPGEQGTAEISDSLFDAYRPQRVKVPGAKPHPTKLVESAAMASVPPPLPTYKPHLPQSIIDKGLLSDAQLEAVISAGEAHKKMLPAAEGDNSRRKGYFIGDGPGVGKGATISGIILDNWNQGRHKAIWVSKNGELHKDAVRDWKWIEQDPKLLFPMDKVQSGEAIKAKQGIAFVGYDTLKMGMSDQEAIAKGGFARRQPVMVNGQGGSVSRIEVGARGQAAQITVKLDNGTTVTVPSTQVEKVGEYTVKTRVDQLVEWVGKNFDGVIAFDEAHNMANAGGIKGKRGMKEAAAKALAGIDLQKRLPKARVVYVSATGATEVANLAYADRLGLWGRGTPFASREDFTNNVEAGGIAAMELIARDMKQLGLYIARNLSYDGVEYDRVEHKLDANQREIYDTLAGAWQVVLQNINDALKTTSAISNSAAKTAAMSAFWGGHQRFFNQIVTSLQMPSVIKSVEKDLAEGRQVVFQMVSTNEASQDRAAAKAKTAEDIEDLDITPRDQIIQLIEKSFPTQQYEEYVDVDGKVRSRPVKDSQGNPVQNKEAVKTRDALIEQLASIRVPQGALDMILDHFGADNVAEVTGRKRRFILKPDEKTGQMRRVEDKRPGNAAAGEISSFQAGKKKLLAFSQKADTGESYHADRKSNSAGARRSHYLIQGGWQADRAVQGLGRSHRSNQESAPIFHLVTTDLPGQRRFISSIARRLGQLGALTKGQRQAGDQGIFSVRDNLESTEARTALRQFFADVARGEVEGVTLKNFEAQSGLKLTDPQGNLNQDLPDITTFLNRLLSLKIDMQNAVFEAFEERHNGVIEARREAGVLDVGLETIKADKIEKLNEQTVHTHEGSDAKTQYVKLKLSNKFKPLDFTKVTQGQWRKIVKWVKSPNGKVYGAAEAPNLTDASSGQIIENYRLISPVSDTRLIPHTNIERRDSKWAELTEREARKLWQDEINAAPEYISHDLHLITGVILPIWDRLKGYPRVVRLQTDKGERLIGRVVPNDAIAVTLKALGAVAKAQSVTPLELFQKLAAGGRATLANGWTLSRRLVAGEHRIELSGPNSFSEAEDVKKDGVFTERIEYKTRYFVPMEAAQAETVLRKLTQYRPVTDLVERGAAPDDMAAGDEPLFEMRESDLATVQTTKLAWTAKDRAALATRLRAELDRLGLDKVGLDIADRLDAIDGGAMRGVNGLYFRRLITIALDANQPGRTLSHEVLHALRDLGLFKDTEWEILAQRSRRTWREQFKIAKHYEGRSEDAQTEEGVAHAYAAWDNGEMKVDGRIARLFKRIRDFIEALRNALRSLGFKTAEDVFRDIKEGKIGGRERTEASNEPMFEVRRDQPPAEARGTPNLNSRIRDGIERVLESKAGRRFIEGTQDLSHPVKLLQRDLEMRRKGAFEDPENFYTRKRLYPGRVGAWTDTFNKKHLDPIVRLMKANEISLSEAGDFVYAEHAPERNEEMDKINPGLGGEGSGMSNEEAEKIVAEAKRGEHAAALEELSKRVDAINDLILDVMEKSGLEKPEVIAEWKKRYKKYRPLRGWEVEPDDAPADYRGPGVGFNVRGKEVKQALGRRSKADNPLVNLFDQAYRTFDRAERNRYLQALYRAIDDLGDEAGDIASLDRGKPKREIDPRTGLVRTVETSNQYMNPKAVYLKFDGNPHFITFRDQELAEAVKRMSPDSVGIFHSYLNLQNKMKALWTHYSPDFLFRHFIFRYPIEGALNSFEQKEAGEHRVSKYIQDAFPFLGNASKAIFASNKGKVADDPEVREMQKYWEEMRRGGGAMMFRNMRDIDLTSEHLQTALKDLSDSPLQNAKAKWRHAVEALDTITNALDNSLRLAAFASARKQGKTVQQAALIAREATVDFYVKGRWANLMGIFFPFSNVAIQTAARMSKAIYRSRIMRRVFMSTILMGFLTSAFNYLVAGDDKDGTPFFDKIPEWDRRLNFIILNPFDTDDQGRPQPIKIPMPYNWAFPLMVGYGFGELMFGSEGPRKIAASMARSALETFTPLGSEQNLAGVATPEAFRPLVHIYTNEDWAGRPVHVDPDFQKAPNAYSPRKTTGAGWSAIAQGVNTATGGDEGKSGEIDLYPEDYREMIDQFAGTQIRLGQNIWNTGEAVAEGKWPEATHIPLARVIRGTDYDAADRAAYGAYLRSQKRPWEH